MNILIVDDDRTSRAFFRRELQKGPYQIIECSDGFEAIHAVHEQEIDLVVLDIEMPDMDGYQVCSWLRSEQFSQKFNQKKTGLLPIIFVTSDESLESRLKGFRAGATDFITKGFKQGELLGIVDRLLRPRNVLEGLTALVVDDSKLVRQMVSSMLVEQRMHVLQAANGQEGYNLLRQNMSNVDMVITDLEMPVMKGDELCHKIRKELGLRELPVIFLTAIPDRGVLIDLFKAGANDYLVKPFVKEELIARLKVTREMFQSLEDEVSERKRMQRHLDETKELAQARLKAAGKVELANAALHNVGNVLNSVSVSCAQIGRFLDDSRLNQLLLALRLIVKNRDDLGAFLTDDPKGKQLPDYFALVSEALSSERQQLLEENREMAKKLQLMRDIIDLQQRNAKDDRGCAYCEIADLVEEAVKVNGNLIEAYKVACDVDLNGCGAVYVRQVEFTHILINLIKNAVEAMRGADQPKLAVHGRPSDEGFLRLTIRDNGEGISTENLARLFEGGFTTKRGGHGFGLPFCAKSIREMGGDLRVTSDGPGKGSSFILTVPLGES